MAKLTPLQAAQRLALQGKIDPAVTQLIGLQEGGDVAAHAALAEIAGYRRKWREVLEHVEVVFGSPETLDTINVYLDMVMLSARAGQELKNWADIGKLAKFAASKLGRKQVFEQHVDAARDLADFAARRGARAFGSPGEPEARRKAKFESAMAEFSTPKKRSKEAVDLDHLFGLALVYVYYPGAVTLYDRFKDVPSMFEALTFLASALARADRLDEAWRVIRTNLDQWFPVEDSQIAPVALVTDEGLKRVMDADKCEKVLRTPRGPGASKSR
jgi:hypothetical protein